MKRAISFALVTIFAVLVQISFSCAPAETEGAETRIENRLKSVSLLKESVAVDPAEILASLERVNEVIDSIGYPDAGYELWIVQSDTASEFRFMVNGCWPNQEVYNEIHENELYRSALEAEQELWDNLTNTWYRRFVRVH